MRVVRRLRLGGRGVERCSAARAVCVQEWLRGSVWLQGGVVEVVRGRCAGGSKGYSREGGGWVPRGVVTVLVVEWGEGSVQEGAKGMRVKVVRSLCSQGSKVQCSVVRQCGGSAECSRVRVATKETVVVGDCGAVE